MVTILVEKASTIGWKAYFQNDQMNWFYGEIKDLAIGALIMGSQRSKDKPILLITFPETSSSHSITIVLEKASTIGWIAYFKNDPERWFYGEIKDLAIGALIMGWQKRKDTPVTLITLPTRPSHS